MREAWQVDFVDQAGKRRHKQFDKKKDADDWMVKTRNQVREGTYTPESTSKTIHQAADAWIERAKAEGWSSPPSRTTSGAATTRWP